MDVTILVDFDGDPEIEAKARSAVLAATKPRRLGGGFASVVRDVAEWDESLHPRDRRGRFIETFSIVRVGYGRSGRVTRNLGDGKVEVEFPDGAVYAVAARVVTVLGRPNGGQPRSAPDPDVAPMAVEAPSPDAVDVDVDVDDPALPDEPPPVADPNVIFDAVVGTDAGDAAVVVVRREDGYGWRARLAAGGEQWEGLATTETLAVDAATLAAHDLAAATLLVSHPDPDWDNPGSPSGEVPEPPPEPAAPDGRQPVARVPYDVLRQVGLGRRGLTGGDPPPRRAPEPTAATKPGDVAVGAMLARLAAQAIAARVLSGPGEPTDSQRALVERVRATGSLDVAGTVYAAAVGDADLAEVEVALDTSVDDEDVLAVALLLQQDAALTTADLPDEFPVWVTPGASGPVVASLEPREGAVQAHVRRGSVLVDSAGFPGVSERAVLVDAADLSEGGESVGPEVEGIAATQSTVYDQGEGEGGDMTASAIAEAAETAADAADAAAGAADERTPQEDFDVVDYGTEFTFDADRLDAAVAIIDKINKRAERAGIAGRIGYEVKHFTEKRQQVLNPDAVYDERQVTDYYVDRVTITLDRPAVRHEGWEFIATLDWAPDTGLIVRRVPGSAERHPTVVRPEAKWCDVCKTHRQRVDTYVVANDKGEQIQVGSNCLAQFMGIRPKELFWLGVDLSGVAALSEDGDRTSTGPRGEAAYGTEYTLALGLGVIKAAGYRSRTVAKRDGGDATADLVDQFLSGRPITGNDPRSVELRRIRDAALASANDPDVRKQAADARDFGRVMEGTGQWAEFADNVRAICSSDTVRPRNLGYLMAVLGAKARRDEREAVVAAERAQGVESGWVGQPKQRLRDIDARVTAVREFASDYGLRTKITFVDTDGNVLVWWASGSQAWNVDDEVRLTATVKKHGEYRGVKETEIQRAVVEHRGQAAAEIAAQEVAQVEAAKEATTQVPVGMVPGSHWDDGSPMARRLMPPGTRVRIQQGSVQVPTGKTYRGVRQMDYENAYRNGTVLSAQESYGNAVYRVAVDDGPEVNSAPHLIVAFDPSTAGDPVVTDGSGVSVPPGWDARGMRDAPDVGRRVRFSVQAESGPRHINGTVLSVQDRDEPYSGFDEGTGAIRASWADHGEPAKAHWYGDDWAVDGDAGGRLVTLAVERDEVTAEQLAAMGWDEREAIRRGRGGWRRDTDGGYYRDVTAVRDESGERIETTDREWWLARVDGYTPPKRPSYQRTFVTVLADDGDEREIPVERISAVLPLGSNEPVPDGWRPPDPDEEFGSGAAVRIVNPAAVEPAFLPTEVTAVDGDTLTVALARGQQSRAPRGSVVAVPRDDTDADMDASQVMLLDDPTATPFADTAYDRGLRGLRGDAAVAAAERILGPKARRRAERAERRARRAAPLRVPEDAHLWRGLARTTKERTAAAHASSAPVRDIDGQHAVVHTTGGEDVVGYAWGAADHIAVWAPSGADGRWTVLPSAQVVTVARLDDTARTLEEIGATRPTVIEEAILPHWRAALGDIARRFDLSTAEGRADFRVAVAGALANSKISLLRQIASGLGTSGGRTRQSVIDAIADVMLARSLSPRLAAVSEAVAQSQGPSEWLVRSMAALSDSPLQQTLADVGKRMDVSDVDVKRGPMGECYANATHMALGPPRMRYVEGYAVNGDFSIPLAHAWNLDEDGLVVDPTWAAGHDYFGVEIPRQAIIETTLETGVYGVLPNLWQVDDPDRVLAQIREHADTPEAREAPPADDAEESPRPPRVAAPPHPAGRRLHRGVMLTAYDPVTPEALTDEWVMARLRRDRAGSVLSGANWSTDERQAQDFAVGESRTSYVWFASDPAEAVVGVVMEADLTTDPTPSTSAFVATDWGETAHREPTLGNTVGLRAHVYMMEPGPSGRFGRQRRLVRTIELDPQTFTPKEAAPTVARLRALFHAQETGESINVVRGEDGRWDYKPDHQWRTFRPDEPHIAQDEWPANTERWREMLGDDPPPIIVDTSPPNPATRGLDGAIKHWIIGSTAGGRRRFPWFREIRTEFAALVGMEAPEPRDSRGSHEVEGPPSTWPTTEKARRYAEALRAGIAAAEPAQPELWRGLEGSPADERVAALLAAAPGDEMTLLPASFTRDPAQALVYGASEHPALLLRVLPGARGVADKKPLLSDQEVITAGQFQVVDVERGAIPQIEYRGYDDVTIVTLRQTGVF